MVQNVVFPLQVWWPGVSHAGLQEVALFAAHVDLANAHVYFENIKHALLQTNRIRDKLDKLQYQENRRFVPKSFM